MAQKLFLLEGLYGTDLLAKGEVASALEDGYEVTFVEGFELQHKPMFYVLLDSVEEVVTVAAPGFTVEPGETGVDVGFSHEDESADIYYTTNGDTPTTSSSKWNGISAIGITESKTVKAIAVVDEVVSEVASLYCVLPVVADNEQS